MRTEARNDVHSIAGVPRSIALFIGWAPRGRIDKAIRLASFTDYERVLGGLDLRTPLGHAVKQFFDNGGSDAYAVRLVDASAAASGAAIGDLALRCNSPGAWGDDYAIRTQPVDRRSATKDDRSPPEADKNTARH